MNIIRNENRAVIINEQEGHVWANLYVNTRSDDIANWTCTAIRWSGRTANGARKWAAKQLGLVALPPAHPTLWNQGHTF